MVNLIISGREAERLQEIAKREHRPVEQVVAQMIDSYVEHDVQRTPQDRARGYKAKLYATARKYWREVNDTERLALTDDQLDEQFWCIDPEGIPRLKTDQDKITLPPDGLLAMAEAAERLGLRATEEEIDYRNILDDEFADDLFRRMQNDDDQANTD